MLMLQYAPKPMPPTTARTRRITISRARRPFFFPGLAPEGAVVLEGIAVLAVLRERQFGAWAGPGVLEQP
ncbi:hypothetical protein GCM10010245_61930 [Streptomyces spectabilis]|nr:hypothetical protein GCM10010245_61930 [Streptomyces spectabilis]